MAEVGNFVQSVKGSDIAYDYNCSECLNRNGTFTEAFFYCPECTKYLCKPCIACEHDVIGRGNVDKWGKPPKFDPCQKHEGHRLQLYCREHDLVCCFVCSQDQHKACSDPVFIPLVAHCKTNKTALKKVNKNLKKLQLKTDKERTDSASKLAGLEQTEARLVAGVKGFRARIDALMDEMEKKSLDDIAKLMDSLKDKYRMDLEICAAIIQSTFDLQKQLDATIEDASLLFSRIKQLNDQVRDKNNLLSDIISHQGSSMCVFEAHTEIESLLQRMQELGKLQTDSDGDRDLSLGLGRAHREPDDGSMESKPYRSTN